MQINNQASLPSEEFFNFFEEKRIYFNEVLSDYLEQKDWPHLKGCLELRKSIEYSLSRGGKRFRPVLCLLIAEALNVSSSLVIPFAGAVEMIHTYSLIHDDLPSMDNDDYRRGEPSNHRVFGEATALLAGDGLLTEAFVLIANAYSETPELGLRLISLLGQAAGVSGMVGGQALDLKSKSELLNQTEMEKLHSMKTGALIKVCVEGVAAFSKVKKEEADAENLKLFAEKLGLSFQLADDLLDSSPEKVEQGSFPSLLGYEATQKYLIAISESAIDLLKLLKLESSLLRDLINYNLIRKK